MQMPRIGMSVLFLAQWASKKAPGASTLGLKPICGLGSGWALGFWAGLEVYI